MSENEIKPVAWTSECQLSAVRIQGDGIMMAKGRGWKIGLYDQSAIDTLTKQVTELKTMLSITEFQRKEMQAERDAAVADAERYRWLYGDGNKRIIDVVIDGAKAAGVL